MAFDKPSNDRYFEDYRPGEVHQFGDISVSQSEIIEFAQRFDPQPMHTDPELAAESLFGELIASGWHTASLAMRLLVDNYLSTVASIVSPGIDELRWLKPVRPGDKLLLRATVLEARPSNSKPDRGLVKSRFEVLNQHGEIVLSMLALNLLLKRPCQ